MPPRLDVVPSDLERLAAAAREVLAADANRPPAGPPAPEHALPPAEFVDRYARVVRAKSELRRLLDDLGL